MAYISKRVFNHCLHPFTTYNPTPARMTQAETTTIVALTCLSLFVIAVSESIQNFFGKSTFLIPLCTFYGLSMFFKSKVQSEDPESSYTSTSIDSTSTSSTSIKHLPNSKEKGRFSRHISRQK